MQYIPPSNELQALRILTEAFLMVLSDIVSNKYSFENREVARRILGLWMDRHPEENHDYGTPLYDLIMELRDV